MTSTSSTHNMTNTFTTAQVQAYHDLLVASQTAQNSIGTFWSSTNTITPKKRKLKMVLKNGNKTYNLPLIQAFSGRLKKYKTEGEVGIEIEVEGKSLFRAPIKYWTIHEDNSLRAVEGEPPVEYVLSKPIPREDVQRVLNYLDKKLKLTKSDVRDSQRTSVHVHVNCQKLTLKQIYQYILLYYIFEDLLIEWCGPQRIGNLFSLGGKHAEYNVFMLEQAVKSDSYAEVFNADIRYTACNTASLGKLGSLEFRSLRGTVDPTIIKTWVDALLCLKDKALAYQDPREIVQDFQHLTPGPFLYKTLSPVQSVYQSLRNKHDFDQRMWDGLRLMRDVAYAVDWEKYNPELEKIDQTKPENAREYFQDGKVYKYHDDTSESYGPGYYWIVNVTSGAVVFSSNGRTYRLLQGTKALMDSSGRYRSEYPAEAWEIDPNGVEPEPEPEPETEDTDELPSVSQLLDEATPQPIWNEPYAPSSFAPSPLDPPDSYVWTGDSYEPAYNLTDEEQ